VNTNASLKGSSCKQFLISTRRERHQNTEQPETKQPKTDSTEGDRERERQIDRERERERQIERERETDRERDRERRIERERQIERWIQTPPEPYVTDCISTDVNPAPSHCHSVIQHCCLTAPATRVRFPAGSLSVWSLQILPVSAWVSSHSSKVVPVKVHWPC